MEFIVVAALLIAGAIHLVPLVGLLGPSRVETMYDVKVDGPDLAVLLVHRALLFGLLGAALVAAVFCESTRPYAIGAVLVSDVAFVAIAAANPGLNDSMKRVVRADLISIGALLIACAGVIAG